MKIISRLVFLHQTRYGSKKHGAWTYQILLGIGANIHPTGLVWWEKKEHARRAAEQVMKELGLKARWVRRDSEPYLRREEAAPAAEAGVRANHVRRRRRRNHGS